MYIEYLVTKEFLSFLKLANITFLEYLESNDLKNNQDLMKEGVISKLAYKEEWSNDKMKGYLNKLYKISPNAFKTLFLKEIAIILDEKYPNHIRESKQIFVISTLSNKIVELNKRRISSYKEFAAFRSYYEARFALDIYNDIVKSMKS